MKRMIWGVCVAAAILISSTVGHTASEDFRFGIGVKTWYNRMDMSYTSTTSGETDYSDKTAYVLMAGPSVKMSYKKFFTGLNYLVTTTDYKTDIRGQGAGQEFAVSRNDLDFLLGFSITPQLSVFTGYKRIKTEQDQTAAWVGVTETFNGVPLGLALSIRPSETVPLAIYGNLGYIYFDSNRTTTAGGDTNWKYDAGFIEVGATYNIVDHVAVSLGYKYQKLWNKSTPDGFYKVDRAFDGVTFAVDYNF